jgi:hypothetical protein
MEPPVLPRRASRPSGTGGNLENIERKRSYGTSLSVLVRTSSKASNTLLDLYFSKFPLFTGKRLDYLEWSKF